MLANSQKYEEVYIISDLHLGGQGSFQIFQDGSKLAWLIEYLRDRATARSLALVLNGDIVDFLADPQAKCFDPEGAVAKLEMVLFDPSFRPVWIALQSFVRTAGRTLVLVLGNHDIELALPPVTERLLQELCGDDAAARGRIRIVFDNSGFSCTVGPAQVLCVHGNEVDKFNIVDYDTLRQVAVAMNRGLDLPEMVVNAGSYLVVNIMNSIKKKYPFVDLLKPETKAALNLLTVIGDDVVRAHIHKVFDLALRWTRGHDAVREGRLGATEPAPPALPPATVAALRDALSSGRPPAGRTADIADRLFGQVEADLDSDLTPTQLAGAGTDRLSLIGALTYLWDRLHGKPRAEAIRDAMQEWLRDDHTFELDTPDEQFRQLSETTGPHVDFLVAGHTHLARALRRPGGGYYYNSGTWSRLIQLTEEVLQDPTRFATVLAAFEAQSMAALQQVPGLLITRPTVVCLREVHGQAIGSLEEVGPSTSGAFQLREVCLADPGGGEGRSTRFVKE